MLRGLAILAVVVVVLQCCELPRRSDGRCVLFNFGDSNSDTGSLPAAYGFYLGPPAGRRFFHRTTGRWSDGRLYIDFIAESLGISYLSPYLESSGSNFTDGVNFAVAGAAAASNQSAIPFPMATQVNQFLHFKNRTRDLRPLELGSMLKEEDFRGAVYSIDVGQNDITLAFLANLTLPEIVADGGPLAAAAAKVEDAVRALYGAGGRKFWVYNTGPLGCLPQTLALRQKPGDEVDPVGCLAAYNTAARALNAGLAAACRRLADVYGTGERADRATVVCTDMYAIKYDLFANHSQYGFERPLMACCGNGGPPYNYVNLKTCGQPTATACPEGERYVSWDGVHYTEDANTIVASKILSGDFSEPCAKLDALCT
ncbi:GDSL esterase/lipase At1g09390-like [Lolium rigidum]|uniref:GDSL esterase/lipase At1g09390-like n=1 Tax=Lolium rigidum TaxID=89674 RepID=UPI001F5C5CD2|nr:GDSL esterase/lipase At1g09390-like [Lolium rigidum]